MNVAKLSVPVILFLFNLYSEVSSDDADCTNPLTVPAITDLKPNDCYSNERYYVNNSEIGCGVSYCKAWPSLVINARCGDNQPPCCPGTTCSDAKIPKCTYDYDSCAKYYITKGNYYKYVKSNLYVPECSADGYFAPKLCRGEPATGRCFCVDVKGMRIFGQEWWNKAEDMTCECSRRKSDLRRSDPDTFVSLHCDSRGNFEPLQCDVISDQCWCADVKTGDVISPVVPRVALTKLPCYQSATSFGSQYLRQCESKLYAQSQIVQLLKKHGTAAQYPTLLCDDDGSYGPYRIQDGQAYCTWKDNSNIGTWQSDATDTSKLTCNCARDTKYFELAGKPMLLQCKGDGNYNAFQKSSGVTYCVDKDGYRKSDDSFVPKGESDCTGVYEQGDAVST